MAFYNFPLQKNPETPSPTRKSVIELPFRSMEVQIDRLTDIIGKFKVELEKDGFMNTEFNFYGHGGPDETQEITSQISYDSPVFPAKTFTHMQYHGNNIEKKPLETAVVQNYHSRRSSVGDLLLEMRDKILVSKSQIEFLYRRLYELEHEKKQNPNELNLFQSSSSPQIIQNKEYKLNYLQTEQTGFDKESVETRFDKEKREETLFDKESQEFTGTLNQNERKNNTIKRIRSGSMGTFLNKFGTNELIEEDNEYERNAINKQIEELNHMLKLENKRYQSLMGENMLLKEFSLSIMKENEGVKEKNHVLSSENSNLRELVKHLNSKARIDQNFHEKTFLEDVKESEESEEKNGGSQSSYGEERIYSDFSYLDEFVNLLVYSFLSI